MDVRLFFIFVIGYVSLAATKNTNDNEISENLEKDSQLKDLLDKLQQFEEWKDTISVSIYQGCYYRIWDGATGAPVPGPHIYGPPV